MTVFSAGVTCISYGASERGRTLRSGSLRRVYGWIFAGSAGGDAVSATNAECHILDTSRHAAA